MRGDKPIIDGALGGEAWQYEPRTMPWDRPAQFAETEDGLMYVFKRMRDPRLTKKLLGLMEAGMPIDMLVESTLMQGFMNGLVSGTALINMVGPMTAIMWRMAESAGIKPQTSDDKVDTIDFDPVDMLAAEKRIQNNTANKAIHANDISQKELVDPDLVDRQSFMKFRPVAKVRN
jgi:hypothetical protein